MMHQSHFEEVQLSYKSHLRPAQRVQVTNSRHAFEYLNPIFAEEMENREIFILLLLNTANEILGWKLIGIGGISGTVADPRKIFQTALKANASALIIAHNHPSGNLKPSEADKKLTKKIKQVGELHDIQLLDHVIMTADGYTSFADDGIM